MCEINLDGFQGWGLDHKRKVIFIRAKTAKAYIKTFSEMVVHRKATLGQVESTIGKLNWLATILLQARIFAPPLQWLLNKYKVCNLDGKLVNKMMKVDLDIYMCNDLRMAVNLLKNNASLPAIYTVFNFYRWPWAIDGTTDAAKHGGLGWIVHDTGKWASVSFKGTPAWDLDQNQAEGLGTLSIIRHIAPRARESKCIIRLEVDNSAILAAVMKQGSFKPRLYAISRAIVAVAAEYNLRIYTRFVESEENIADWPSRPEVDNWFEKFCVSAKHHRGPWGKVPIYPTDEVHVSLPELMDFVKRRYP